MSEHQQSRGVRGLWNFLGYKMPLDWPKIGLNYPLKIMLLSLRITVEANLEIQFSPYKLQQSSSWGEMQLWSIVITYLKSMLMLHANTSNPDISTWHMLQEVKALMFSLEDKVRITKQHSTSQWFVWIAWHGHLRVSMLENILSMSDCIKLFNQRITKFNINQ